MKHAFKTLVGVAAAMSIVVAAGTASADDDSKCHQTIAKNITKYQATLAKGLIGCHKSRLGLKIGEAVDCNVTNVTGQGADQKSKRGSNRTKAHDKIVDTCTDVAPLTLAAYVACPSPNAGPTTTPSEIANCLLNLSESYINDIGEQLMGNPDVTPAKPMPPLELTDAAADCQGAIGKALSKFIKTAGQNRAKCHASNEKETGTYVAYGTGLVNCATNDPSTKIAPALAALKSAIDTECPAAAEDFPYLGNCASDLVETNGVALANALEACGVDKVANPIANGLAAATLELPGTCAAVADVTINAGRGIKTTATRLDSGWKGTAHQVDIVDQSIGAVSLDSCDSDCTDCNVEHNPKNGNCRCSNNVLTECTDIGVVGGVCGAGTCNCMFGPPLAISASATPVCVVNVFAAEFDGTTAEVGEYEVTTRTRALVHTGISQTKPCPTCVGDGAPNSGDNSGGTCSGGPRNTLACDENANHPDFGPTSFDCPPTPGANISGSGLNLALVFESGAASITAGIPAAGTFCDGANACHCSVCSGDAKVGCTVDADCAAVGAGTCGQALANNPEQNACTGSCTNDGNGNGECDGPVIDYCSGFLNGYGNGIITCSTDGDCDSNDCNGDNVATPGECGTCSFAGLTQCFLPTVTATGTPGIYESDGVSVFCSGQTGNGGVDDAGGLPGPGRVKLNFDFDLYCADGTTQFQLPEGSNCP